MLRLPFFPESRCLSCAPCFPLLFLTPSPPRYTQPASSITPRRCQLSHPSQPAQLPHPAGMQATAGGQPLYTSSTVTAGFLRLPVVRYHELLVNRDTHKVTKSQSHKSSGLYTHTVHWAICQPHSQRLPGPAAHHDGSNASELELEFRVNFESFNVPPWQWTPIWPRRSTLGQAGITIQTNSNDNFKKSSLEYKPELLYRGLPVSY
jgi:hypothetical protein